MLNQVREITRITVLGAVLNFFLAVLKLSVGLVIGSPALIADAAHSLSDLSTDAFVIIGARLSSRPPDESHPFGHGKYETTSAFMVGVALIAVGFFVIFLDRPRREIVVVFYEGVTKDVKSKKKIGTGKLKLVVCGTRAEARCI